MTRAKDKIIFDEFYKGKAIKTELKRDIYRQYLNHFLNKELASFLNQEHITLVADLGCGDGRLEDFLINGLNIRIDGKKFLCFDTSETAIQSAVQREIPNCDFIKQDCCDLAGRYENYFDAVIIINVLHHLNDLSIINDVYKMLKPGGSFLIVDLPWENIFQKMMFRVYDYSPQFLRNIFTFNDLSLVGERPVRYHFTKKQLRNRLKQANFHILSQEYRFLFLFLYFYLERALVFMKFPRKRIKLLFSPLFSALLKVEQFLLKFHIFQKQASIYKVICAKNN